MDGESCYWFVFEKDRLLLRQEGDAYQVPFGVEAPARVSRVLDVSYNGGPAARAAELGEPAGEGDGFALVGLRASWDCLPEEMYALAGKAYQLLYWDSHSRFCPACGTPTERVAPIAKRCPVCGYEIYPTIATAMIVLIRKGDSILLVRARNFRGTFHGLVAGFLEVGETLEECVRREVREETGLEVDHIRYFGNQPWPYPSGLMVGFVADYAGGEIKLQDDELSAGAFYTRNNLPEIPRKLSMARRLIDWWLAEGERGSGR